MRIKCSPQWCSRSPGQIPHFCAHAAKSRRDCPSCSLFSSYGVCVLVLDWDGLHTQDGCLRGCCVGWFDAQCGGNGGQAGGATRGASWHRCDFRHPPLSVRLPLHLKKEQINKDHEKVSHFEDNGT